MTSTFCSGETQDGHTNHSGVKIASITLGIAQDSSSLFTHDLEACKLRLGKVVKSVTRTILCARSIAGFGQSLGGDEQAAPVDAQQAKTTARSITDLD
jgi:hypothetical protein